MFGDAWAAYAGRTDDNSLHAHAAIQVVLDPSGAGVVTDEQGGEHRGCGLLIRPLVSHALSSPTPLTLIYLEPQSPLAFELLDRVGPDDICVLPPELVSAPAPRGDLNDEVNAFFAPLAGNTHGFDARLAEALAAISDAPGDVSIAEAAQTCGLSESRLRTLARKHMGLPLSTWLVWRKLERAARALSTGASLADAALVGGFADQAHFTRAMRRMFGVTPNTAARTLT